ncbi:hypothetical protein CYMTET_7662 [Cymbomonas tetramitiformis]|uniref:Glutathione S-transferase 3, mitochondrial n=1 Tax=Cymbomonas tetramitiformis TaxID=36881 RepID=A0AAE0LGV9_9CHLO|nr:hypothetical protein CYMTET_7662 [Cymbomonas tetramitiformis]
MSLSGALSLRLPQPRSPFAKNSPRNTRPKIRGSRKHSICKCSGLIDLEPTYGVVAWTAASSYVLVQWQAVQVAIARRKYNVQYPTMYEIEKEDEASVFNCYQRAHQNTLEAYPSFLALLMLGGLAYPLVSSAAGGVWIAGRVVYSLGYYSGDPSQRMKGIWHNFGLLTLWVNTILFGAEQLDLLP